ncbi:MAG: dethiobiotin synthase [Pseudomonadota bacterium]|nr:dethiobiotin synthase [Pseudomonadota bacterium]
MTGTDTGIGKTFASVTLLYALRARGLRATGMKPLASGCVLMEGQWRNDDALALQYASDPRPPYEVVNPYALPAATAPEIAARDAGIEIGLPRIETAYRALQTQSDIVVVEGVGGWAAPLSPTLDQVDVVRTLELRTVLVVGLRLGCISHARLVVRAIEGDGLKLAGWIASDIVPEMEPRDAYFELLRQRIAAPCLGRLPFAAGAPPATLASRLDTSALR